MRKNAIGVVRFMTLRTKGRVFAINKRNFPSNFTLDLCPKCYNDLLTFMANPDMVSMYFKCQEEEKLGIK